MSSYITFCITDRKSYELYSEKYDEINNSTGGYWLKDYSQAYKLMDRNFILYYCSRSFQPYRVFYEEIGFTNKYQILTEDILSHVLNILEKELEEVSETIDYYDKYGTFHKNINCKKIKNGLDFLDSISCKVNDDNQIENIKSILINIDIKDDEFEEPISMYKEERDDLKGSIQILSALLQMLNCIGEKNVILYSFD